jgi:6-phospho-3-hexuloisomerase
MGRIERISVRSAVQLIHDEHVALLGGIDWSALNRLADCVEKSQRVFTLGRGRSGLVMAMFAMRLVHLGKEAHVVGEATVPAAKEGDLLVVASASGTTDTVCSVLEAAGEVGVTRVGLTASPHSRIAGQLDCCVAVITGQGLSTTAGTRQFRGSLFEQAVLLLTDAVIIRLADQNVTWREMSERHANLE